MYNIWNYLVYMLVFPLITNNAIHNHFTWTNINLHIDNVSNADKYKFLYNSIIIWNECPVELRTLPKLKYMQQCMLHLFFNVNT